jgi:hypothetical protein
VRRLRGFQIFAPGTKEVTGDWRTLQDVQLLESYLSPDVIRMIKRRRKGWSGHVACMGQKRNAYCVVTDKPKAQKPLGRTKLR